MEIIEKLWTNGADKLEDIMNWPDARVMGLYVAIVKREGMQSIELQRAQMIAATFSNPTWDDPKNNREQFINNINQNFNKAIEFLLYGEKEVEIDWENPFYAAAKRNLEKTRQKLSWAIEGKKMHEVIEMDDKQVQARLESRKEIDQL